MKILFAASEAVPFAATGGLGDVIGSLPRSIAAGQTNARGPAVWIIPPELRSGCAT